MSIRLRIQSKGLSTRIKHNGALNTMVQISDGGPVDWLQEYDFSEEEIRSVVAGMQEMSAIDGDVDPQELELIAQVAEGIEGDVALDLSVFTTPESKEHFLYLVTFVAIVDTTINDAEHRLLTQYAEALDIPQNAQYFIDAVGERFLRTVFADSELLRIWIPRLKDELRLSDEVVERLLS